MSLDGNHTRELVTKGIQNKALMDALTISAGGLSGGISASISGGDFWDGARQGLIVAGLNHVYHRAKDGTITRTNDNRGGDEIDYLVDDDGKVIEQRKVEKRGGYGGSTLIKNREYGLVEYWDSQTLYDPSLDIFELYASGKISSTLFSELLFSKYTAQWIIKNSRYLQTNNWVRLGMGKSLGNNSHVMRLSIGAGQKAYDNMAPGLLKNINGWLRNNIGQKGHFYFPNWKP